MLIKIENIAARLRASRQCQGPDLTGRRGSFTRSSLLVFAIGQILRHEATLKSKRPPQPIGSWSNFKIRGRVPFQCGTPTSFSFLGTTLIRRVRVSLLILLRRRTGSQNRLKRELISSSVKLFGLCPLWVKRRHLHCTSPCPLWAKSGHPIDVQKYVRSLNLGVLVQRQCDLKVHSVRVICGCRQLPPVCFDNRFTD